MSDEPKLLRRFRRIAVAEGISFLVLLFLAMPLKYGLGMDWAVKITGWLHGILFIAYVYILIRCRFAYNWSLKFVALAFLASLLPFGPFVLDRRLAPQTSPSREACG